jgi:hypothetical protein
VVRAPEEPPALLRLLQTNTAALGREALEAVMNSITIGLGMRETEIAKEPTRPCNPHFYAVLAQVHNTL